MGLNVFAYPQVVYRQSAAPTGINSGTLWLDTDDNNLYYYNGSSWKKLSIATGSMNTEIIQNSLSILEIQAADTITAGTSAAINNEIFSDANGYLNRVNTTNTTGIFSSNKYINETVEEHGKTLNTNDGAGTGKSGWKITTTRACSLISLTKVAGCTATKAYLLDSSKTAIDNATFIGNVATFATPQSLANATSYYFAVDNDGGNFDGFRYIGDSYPYTTKNMNIVGGMNASGSDSTSSVWQLVTAETTSNAMIETNMQTLSSTPTNFQIFSYKDSTAGTGVVTGDISFDNGANYQTGIALDTPTAITDVGTQLILKLNLGEGAAGGTAEAQGYGVLYW